MSFISHSSYTLHASLVLFTSSFLSLLPLNSFVYSWQKGGEYIREYTWVFCHFYITHVHILRRRNSISCTFVGGESHSGDAYTKGKNTYFIRKPCCVLFYIMLVFLFALWCFELCLGSILYCFYRIMLMCWTCIHLYAIVLYWLHVRMIICFAMWSLWSFPYDCSVFDQVAHMFHIMFIWSHFTCYIILVILLLALSWGSNAFCAIVSGYRYICSKFITSFRLI